MRNECETASCCGTDSFFSKQSKRYLKRFKRRGLAKESRLIVEGIRERGIDGETILEIGGGIGALHLTLLQQGAARAMGVDISEGMVKAAEQLSRELELHPRTSYLLGDVVELTPTLQSHDIVILDKVVCCYPDLDRLLEASVSLTGSVYALSYPRPSPIIHLLISIPIVVAKLLRWKFRPYWHNWDAIQRYLSKRGFRRTYSGSTFFWSVLVFSRAK